MILNLDFHSKEDVEEITEEEKSQFERYFSGFSTQEKITENTSLEDFKILTNLRKHPQLIVREFPNFHRHNTFRFRSVFI